jgi:hypothetical protein
MAAGSSPSRKPVWPTALPGYGTHAGLVLPGEQTICAFPSAVDISTASITGAVYFAKRVRASPTTSRRPISVSVCSVCSLAEPQSLVSLIGAPIPSNSLASIGYHVHHRLTADAARQNNKNSHCAVRATVADQRAAPVACARRIIDGPGRREAAAGW